MHVWRRCYHSYYVSPLFAAGFEQQRNVENDDVVALGFGFCEEGALGSRDNRMHDALELLHGVGIFRDLLAKLRPIDPAIGAYDARKSPFDRRNRLTARRISCVDRSVSVVNRNAACGEHGRRRRLAHAYRACECELDHARAATASRQAFSASASSGDIPNQMRKAAAACPTNMGKPS